MSKRSILLVVEGERTEKVFFKTMFSKYGLDYNIVQLKTNIYSLYNKMREYDFNCDLKDALKEIHPGEYDEILAKKYAYTYLIFDCDIQHDMFQSRSEVFNKNIEEFMLSNMNRLEELANYFDNETDPTIGKLYINFPMMESYRDCDSFRDMNYLDTFVKIQDIIRYKSIVGTRKLCNFKRVDEYTIDDFDNLTCLNLLKSEYLLTGNKLDYDEYLKLHINNQVLKKQESFVKEDNKLSVLNTSLLILIDYYGNQNHFYDDIINKA